MTPRPLRFSLLFLVTGLLAAKPPAYLLWISTPDGKLSEVVADLLERKLTDARISVLKQQKRYETMPHLPVAVCAQAEYFLFAPGEELLAVGCMNAEFPGLTAVEIHGAVKTHQAAMRRGENPVLTARVRK